MDKKKKGKADEEKGKADEKKYAIPKSEITKVELKKGLFGKSVRLNVITNKKKYKWIVNTIGLDSREKDVKLKDYENILRQAFPEKLSVKK